MDHQHWICNAERYAQLGQEIVADWKAWRQRVQDAWGCQAFVFNSLSQAVIGIQKPEDAPKVPVDAWRKKVDAGLTYYVPDKRRKAGKDLADQIRCFNTGNETENTKLLKYIREEMKHAYKPTKQKDGWSWRDTMFWGEWFEGDSMYIPTVFVCGGMLFARAPLVDEPDRYYPAPEDWREVTAKAWHDEYDRRYKAQQEQGG